MHELERGVAHGGLLLGLVLALGTATGVLWYARAHAAAPAAPPAAAPADKPAAPAPVVAPPPPQATIVAVPMSAKGKLSYSCGQEAEALNGVTGTVRVDWVGPWSPIKQMVTDPNNGWQWYVHEDGSRSTTRMIDMNGVPQAMGLRAQPTEPLPVLDDAMLKQMQQQGAGAKK